MNPLVNADSELDDESLEDAGTLDDAVRDVMSESEASRQAYLKESWLAATIALLRRARQQAGLTQADLAERLSTRQPSIARLERAEDTTLGRLWDYLAACGVAPAEIETMAVSDLARFVEANPAGARSASVVRTWLADDEHEGRAVPATKSPASMVVATLREPKRLGTANGQPSSNGAEAGRPARAEDV